MKVVVIGTGFGAGVMAPVYASLGFEVETVSPRDPDAVRRAVGSGPGLVSVHSPPFLHRDHVGLAVDAGCNVLCDKPFGLDVGEAKAMRDQTEAAGVLHFLNFEFREHPARRALKSLLAQGDIGNLEHVSWNFFGSAMRSREHDWRAEASLGGGWLGAYGSHAIDTVRWLFDAEIQDCGGLVHLGIPYRKDRDGVIRPSTSEVGYSAWFQMANGQVAVMDTDYAASIFMPQRILLLGSHGALELIDDAEVIIRKPGLAPKSVAFERSAIDPHEPGLTPWLAKVRDALTEGRQISPSFDDGLAMAKVLQKLRANLKPVGRTHAASFDQVTAD